MQQRLLEDSREALDGGAPAAPRPPALLLKQTTLSDFGPSALTRKRACRTKVLGAFILVSMLQGATFATFSMLPTISRALFPAVGMADLSWTLNSNNVAQAAFIPTAIWMLRDRPRRPGVAPGRTGLRAIVLLAVLMQVLQSMIWVAASLYPEVPHIKIALQLGAAAGGVCTACLQGSCSRLSAVWFPAHQRGTANALCFSALFAAQSLAYATPQPRLPALPPNLVCPWSSTLTYESTAVRRAGLGNVTTFLATSAQWAPGLAAASCDAIYSRMVYHMISRSTILR